MDTKISNLINEGVKILEGSGVGNARFEATLLLGFTLKWQKHTMLMNMQEELLQTEAKRFFELIELRRTGYPLQYITETQDFMGLELNVNPCVLIPRYDTEVLVESILKKDLPPGTIAVDVGTGSGAIAVSLAKFRPAWDIYAIDISERAIEVAENNCNRHKVSITFLQGDLLEPLENIQLKPNLIVSNPPYIPSGEVETLMKEVQFEPGLALNGGQDGLDVYRRLIPQAYSILTKDGYIALEIGYDQSASVSSICTKEGFRDIEIIKDYQQHDRVVIGIK
ncbi:MAG: hypothetical protein APF76_17405 [Desulfitibacter sp. BRH_c19]|nr:MAG: hypothetical protein APF76_17405 [Desulfitibacter sp. BRH_c19]